MPEMTADTVRSKQGPDDMQGHPLHRQVAPVSKSEKLPIEKLQAAFDKNFRHSERPVKHDKAAVLIISWDKSDMDPSHEISQLEDIFSNTYRFEVTQVQMKTSSDPQLQAICAVSTFAKNNQGPHQLCIIYYAGHGYGNDIRGELHLTGVTDQKSREEEERRYNSIAWHAVEMCLKSTRVDFLLIFDCCSAGSLRGRSPERCFEFLGACDHGERTALPGPDSFTSALVAALQQLRVAAPMGFTSRDLQRTICRASNNLRSKPVLFHRFTPHFDHVWITPLLTPEEAKAASSSSEQLPTYREEQPMEFLDLRFRLGRDVDENLIATLAQVLDKLSRDQKEPLAIENVNLIQHTSQPLVTDIVKHWRNTINKHKGTRDETETKPYGDLKVSVHSPRKRMSAKTLVNYTNNHGSKTIRNGDAVQTPREPQRLRIDLNDLMAQIWGIPRFLLHLKLLFTFQAFGFGIMLTIFLYNRLQLPGGDVFVLFTNLTLY